MVKLFGVYPLLVIRIFTRVISGDPNQEDMDVILILAKDSYYVARYDDEVDKVTQYQRVALADVEKIEFGTLDQPTFQVKYCCLFCQNDVN